MAVDPGAGRGAAAAAGLAVRRPGLAKPAADDELHDYVRAGLRKSRSPEQIRQR